MKSFTPIKASSGTNVGTPQSPMKATGGGTPQKSPVKSPLKSSEASGTPLIQKTEETQKIIKPSVISGESRKIQEELTKLGTDGWSTTKEGRKKGEIC